MGLGLLNSDSGLATRGGRNVSSRFMIANYIDPAVFAVRQHGYLECLVQ